MERASEQAPRPLVVLCDGTWCGREADTRSNIYLLAKMMGIPINDPTDTDVHQLGDKACYIFNGVTGQDMEAQCVDAYKFIVCNYTEKREVWMFGLSRGSYIVRTIAGMINNCGIIKPVRNEDDSINRRDTDLLCGQVYKMYRSDNPINEPKSDQSIRFRRKFSWPLIGDEREGDERRAPPVKFLGLFDTVGSLGIPDFTGGVGLDWPKFHDQNVSSTVELVYHAVSLHDRFFIFPPCLASRNPREGKSDNYGITQKYFPGCHYDLGRQNFRFLRPYGGTMVERFLAKVGMVNKEIQPNEVLSDLVLKWMIEAVVANDPTGGVIPTHRAKKEIELANQRMVAPDRKTGDGDVYKNAIQYAPFGTWLFAALSAIWGTRWQNTQIYQTLFALRDRVVADWKSQVYNFTATDPAIPGADGRTIRELAGIDDTRYPSMSYATLRICRVAMEDETEP